MEQQHAATYLDLDTGTEGIVKVEIDDQEVEYFDSSGGDGIDFLNEDKNENDSFLVSYALPLGNEDEDPRDDTHISSVNQLEESENSLLSSCKKPAKRGRKRKLVGSATSSKPSQQPEQESSPVILTLTPPKYTSQDEFTAEMEQSIKNIVNECIAKLDRDPREYHPFYLRVYKFTTIGKQLGFLNSEEEVDSIWRQYDNFATSQFEKWKSDKQQFEFNGEHSAYLTYILTKKVILHGKAIIRLKNTKQQIKERMKEYSAVESIARNFRRDWEAAGISDAEARENLNCRLDFFQHVKHFTYPGDVTKLNYYWKGLLNGFSSSEWKEDDDDQERISEKCESQSSPSIVKRSGRTRKAPTRLVPETETCKRRKVRQEDGASIFKKKIKRSAAENDEKPKISGGIEGGTCEHCGKVMKTQLARHIREVHYKIYPAGHKKISELKEKVGGGDYFSSAEEISNTKMGGECPHCHKVIKRQLQYHILKMHGEACGQLLAENPKPGAVSELKKLYEEQKKEEDEAEEQDKSTQKKVSAGGKCPHCNKMLKKYLQYHIWRTHVTVEGKIINRPVKQDLKHLTVEQKREHWKEWQRLRRLNRTEEERQEESRKLRERYYKKINSMTPEELEEFRKKNRFQAFQKRVEQQFLPEDERERLKTIKFLSRQAWLDRKDEDWKEARKQQVKERVQAKRAVMTAQEREEERRRNKEWRQKLSGEKLAKYRESVRKSMKKYFDKLKRDNPEEYFNKVNNRENKLKWSGFLNYQRERTAKETPEQREARLLRYRVNQAKRKARHEFEREGASPAEIEKRLKDLEEQMRSQPRPAISSTYKPRLGARKPHKVPVPEIKAEEIKICTELQQQHPPDPPQSIPTPQVVVEQRIVDVSQNHHQQQQINLVAVITPHHHHHHHQEPMVSQQQQVLYVPFHQVSIPTVVTSTQSSTVLEFETTPTLSLVQCTAAQGLTTTTAATTFSIISSHAATPTQLNSEFDGHHFVSDPPPSYDGDDGGNNNFCHFPSAEQATTVICVIEPAVTPSATETFSPAASVPPPPLASSPEPRLSMDDLVNASSSSEILQSAITPEPLEPEPPMKLEQPSKQTAMCDECGKTFTTQASVQVHKTVVHTVDPSVLICPKCQYHCSSTISLWNHFTTYHLEDVDTFPVELFPNGKTFPPTPRQPRTEPYKQIRSDPNHPHSCPQCSKTFVQKCTLDDHIRRTHEGKGHFCDVCAKDQQSPAKLWRHKVERHGMKDLPPPEGVPAVRCKYCTEIIMRGYEQHVKKRHPDQLDDFNTWYVPEKGTAPRRHLHEKVQCPHCPSMVKHKLLNRHIKNMHTSLPKQSCPECGIEFKRKDHLKKHYRDQHVVVDIEKKLEAKQLIKVTTLRNFTATCLLCQTQIVSKVLLRAHFVQDHHEIFQECQLASLPIFKCAICQEKFNKEVQLKSHMQATHPDKLFTCQHCGIFKFSQTELSAHERMHRKTDRDRMRKQGQCSLCDFDAKLTFPETVEHEQENKATVVATAPVNDNNLENILREHVKTLHSERYFPCPNPNCEKFTVNKDDFQHHMARCQKNGVMNSKEFVKKTVNKLMIFCPECRKPFKFYQFNKHLQGSHKMKIEREEIPCELCKPRTFKCRRFYVAHMHLVHQIPFNQLIDLAPDDAMRTNTRTSGKVKTRKWRRKRISNENEDQIKMDNDEGADMWKQIFSDDKVTSEIHQQKKRKIGPKSKTQRQDMDHDRKIYKKPETGGKKRGRKPRKNSSGGAKCLVNVEKYRKLLIRVERMSDDLFNYYLARRFFIKDEPEY